METLDVTSEWTVQLGTPRCDLGWEGCAKDAAIGFRIHTCRFSYACPVCAAQWMHKLDTSYRRFAELKCKNCGLEFLKGNYMTIFEL